MLQNLTGAHLVVIVAIVLLLFGAPKLPALARSLGQSMRILKNEVSTTETRADAGPEPDQTSSGGDPAGVSSSTASGDATPVLPGGADSGANTR